MKTQIFTILALVAFCQAQTQTQNLENTLNLWSKSDSLFSPKLFKFMLMLPTDRDQIFRESQEKIHDGYKQAAISESEVHPTDLAGSLIKDFLVKGGKSRSAHVFSKSKEVTKNLEKYIVGFRQNSAQQKVDLIHRGRKVSNLRTSGLFGCLSKNPDLGVQMTKSVKTNEVTLKISDAKLTFSAENFKPYETFLTDICYLVEYAKVHFNDFKNNALIHHLESYSQILNSAHRDSFIQVLTNGLSLFKKTISKTFGQNNVDFLISMFTEPESGNLPKLDHSRILAEEPDTGDEKPKVGDAAAEADYGYSVRLISGIVMIFLYLYVCVYIYDIEVHKDSLVYSNLLTSKKK